MKSRCVAVVVAVFCLLSVSSVRALDTPSSGVKNDVIAAVVEKAMGKVKILRIEKSEPSRIPGIRQVRIWYDSPYGETPLLFYMTEDGKMFIAGSMFDAEGKNLTRVDVGTTIPRSISEKDMDLHPDLAIGPSDAKLKVVLWVGLDPVSKKLIELFNNLYEANRDLVSIRFKLYPSSERDAVKMLPLTCAKGDQFLKLYALILGANPAWGTEQDIQSFKEGQGLTACNDAFVSADLEQAKKLMLPRHPHAFVNGVLLGQEPTREYLGKLAGVELK